MPFFRHEGHRLAYTIRGSGPRVVVLLPGLLFSQRMHAPLARALAERDNRVITLDLLGHGRSDRPKDMWSYSMTTYGEEVVALLDHLDVDEAVVGGTSLGANTTLEVAALAPERLRGMVVEMPVLDNALLGCAIAFTPLMIALTFGEPAMKLVQAGARRCRAGSSRSGATSGSTGSGRTPRRAPPSSRACSSAASRRTGRARTFETPALVIGHRRDPVHPFSDAGMLADELPNGRLVEADSFFELRFTPERLTSEIADFVDECWKPKRAKRPPASLVRPAPRRGLTAGRSAPPKVRSLGFRPPMSSRQEQKEKRRQERIAAEKAELARKERQQRLYWIGGGIVGVLAIGAVVFAIVAGGGGDKKTTDPETGEQITASAPVSRPRDPARGRDQPPDLREGRRLQAADLRERGPRARRQPGRRGSTRPTRRPRAPTTRRGPTTAYTRSARRRRRLHGPRARARPHRHPVRPEAHQGAVRPAPDADGRGPGLPPAAVQEPDEHARHRRGDGLAPADDVPDDEPEGLRRDPQLQGPLHRPGPRSRPLAPDASCRLT